MHGMDHSQGRRRAGGHCERFTRAQAVKYRDNTDLRSGSAEQEKANREAPGTLPYLSPVMLTVRMHPSAIPDTRNFEFSPLKAGSPRMQSGQLLYFMSGFLTIQLEMQNFLSSQGLGGPVIHTQIFREQDSEGADSTSNPHKDKVTKEHEEEHGKHEIGHKRRLSDTDTDTDTNRGFNRGGVEYVHM